MTETPGDNAKPSNKLSIIGLVVSLFALVFSPIMGLAGLAFGVVARRAHEPLAKTTIVAGVVALVGGVALGLVRTKLMG